MARSSAGRISPGSSIGPHASIPKDLAMLAKSAGGLSMRWPMWAFSMGRLRALAMGVGFAWAGECGGWWCVALVGGLGWCAVVHFVFGVEGGARWGWMPVLHW